MEPLSNLATLCGNCGKLTPRIDPVSVGMAPSLGPLGPCIHCNHTETWVTVKKHFITCASCQTAVAAGDRTKACATGASLFAAFESGTGMRLSEVGPMFQKGLFP